MNMRRYVWHYELGMCITNVILIIKNSTGFKYIHLLVSHVLDYT